MENRELKPCPVCNKLPKIKRDYCSEECGFGAWCTIQCKPFLRKPHLKIEEGKASWERALKYGIEHWNRRADDASRYIQKIKELAKVLAEEYYTAEAYEELREENERLRDSSIDYRNIPYIIAEAKADTVREMQERLRKEAYPFPCAIGVEYAVPICKIDQVAKEMLDNG